MKNALLSWIHNSHPISSNLKPQINKKIKFSKYQARQRGQSSSDILKLIERSEVGFEHDNMASYFQHISAI